MAGFRTICFCGVLAASSMFGVNRADSDVAANGSGTSQVVSIRVGTYNIRTSFADKGTPNAWKERKADVVALIRKLGLDAFALQEVSPKQADFLKKSLPDYGMVGDFRGAARRTGEASPVFYGTKIFSAGESGTFWLSETPEVPGSKSLDTAFPRICTWVRLTDKASGVTFCFANAHTDHKSRLACREGLKLIMRRMRDFAPDGMPVVFTGDHKCYENSAAAKAVSAVLRDAIYATETPPVGPWSPDTGFKWREKQTPIAEWLARPPEKRKGRGDYIYVSHVPIVTGNPKPLIVSAPVLQIVGGGCEVRPGHKTDFPSVVEGRVESGKLVVKVHNCTENRIVMEEMFA